MLTLYGTSLSPYVRKTLIYCEEKGLAFTLAARELGSRDPAFLAASPFCKIPAMQDGAVRLSDSSAIIHYLEAKHPAPPLIPTDPVARGRTIWFEEFADTIIGRCVTDLFFHRIVGPRLIGGLGDPAVADAAEAEQLPPIRDYLERELEDGRRWLVGDTITLADIAVTAALTNIAYSRGGLDDGGHPALGAYFARMSARDSVARWVACDRVILAGTG